MRNERKQRKVNTSTAKRSHKLAGYWYVDTKRYQRLLAEYNDLNQDKKEVILYY